MNNFSCWIEKEYKNYYLDSKRRGIRCIYSNSLTDEELKTIKKYIKFISNKYFFPIRCIVHFVSTTSKKNKFNGIRGVFYNSEENNNHPATIYVVTDVKGKKIMIYDILSNLTCLLTYYFQWYFFLDEERSHRSLEIEASQMAGYLVELFCDKYDMSI